jgi:hypothetical protein
MIPSKFRSHSRLAIALLETYLGFYLFINSFLPLVNAWEDLPGPGLDEADIRYFLNGTGFWSTGFWLRILAIVVGLMMIIMPYLKDTPKHIKRRATLSYISFILFSYVGVLTLIYTQFLDYFWLAPVATGLFSATVYLGNLSELRFREAIEKSESELPEGEGGHVA